VIASNSLRPSEGPSTEKLELKGLNLNQVMEIIDGFLMGMNAGTNIPELSLCIADENYISTWIDKAVNDFSKSNLDGTQEGFSDLSEAFKFLPKSIKMCEAASAEVAGLVNKAIQAWAQPESLQFNHGLCIKYNGAEVYSEISEALQDYKNHDWYNFGLYIGKAAFKIIYMPDPAILLNQNNQCEDFNITRGIADATLPGRYNWDLTVIPNFCD
jgi:hypothetical protein